MRENENNYIGATSQILINFDTWYHLCVVYDKKLNKVIFYINGVESGSFIFSHIFSNLGNHFYNFLINHPGISDGNGPGMSIPCYINDVRVYDHALSPKEVKELSKGLVLHYKLDGGINKIIPPEYQEVEYLDSSGTQYINTGYIATTYPLQLNAKMSWLAAPSSEKDFWGNFNATTQTSSIYCFVCGGRGTNKWYQWGGSVWEPFSNLTINTVYDTSFTYTGASGRIANIIEEVTNNISNNNALATTDGYIGLFSGAGARAYCCGSFRIYSASIIHEGNMVRNFIPCYRISDNVAGMYDTITNTFFTNVGSGTFTIGPNVYTTEYDCSGYGNNGTITGTLTNSSDSPRYNASTYFPSGANYINAGRGAMVTDSITVNLWINFSVWGNPISCTEGGGWNFEESGGIQFPIYIASIGYKIANSGVTSATLKDNKWHMLTGTYDKNNVKIYIDGVLKTTTVVESPNNIAYNGANVIFLAAEAAGSATTPYGTPAFKGLMSDVRIYSTALSADDVLELYHTSASIGNDGTVYAYELEEV